MHLRELKKSANNILRNKGDAIYGERVIAMARKVGKIYIEPGTSKHQIQRTILKDNVFCLIDKAFRIKDQKLRRK